MTIVTYPGSGSPARVRRATLSAGPAHLPLDGVLERPDPPEPRRLRRAPGPQRPERARQEARGAEPGVPVRRGKLQDRSGRRHDIPRDRRYPEAHTPEQVDDRLPPA